MPGSTSAQKWFINSSVLTSCRPQTVKGNRKELEVGRVSGGSEEAAR